MLESLFHKVAGLQARNFIKKRLQQVFYCEYCEIFKNSFFDRTPPVAAFEICKNILLWYIWETCSHFTDLNSKNDELVLDIINLFDFGLRVEKFP